ncbi:MAG: ParB/Srx family N-terminal domain-containing protein [Hyphomicrobiales bacterium]|nr:ParB/Srx family N-terminal domain-containing protein [Hyphomicrobiales bacterium]
MSSRWPAPQRVTSAEDLDKIQFVDDMAEIEVPVECLDLLPFKNEDRYDSARLHAVERLIRRFGYNNMDPVIVRLGRRGRWVIVDGGHRVTAARRISREFFTNLFGKKVRRIHFILFRTPLSNTRLNDPPDIVEKAK